MGFFREGSRQLRQNRNAVPLGTALPLSTGLAAENVRIDLWCFGCYTILIGGLPCADKDAFCCSPLCLIAAGPDAAATPGVVRGGSTSAESLLPICYELGSPGIF